MSQFDFIKDIARYGLANDYDRLLKSLYDLIDYSQKINKNNFAAQLRSIIKESKKNESTTGCLKNIHRNILEADVDNLIIRSVLSSYKLKDLICSPFTRTELEFFIKERRSVTILQNLNIPLSNKIILYGPSGCGKTLAAYVLAGELEKPLIIVNLGAIVSSKLGETSKNLTQIFKKAAYENAIIFFDEFDSLGKIRDYDQDHGEMKRVVNTILQLFDFLGQDSIVLAATNQIQMIDNALVRRFDLSLKLDYPNHDQIVTLVDDTLKGRFSFDDTKLKNETIKNCQELSYYVIKRTLLTAIKRTIISEGINSNIIRTKIWSDLISYEKENGNH